MRISSKAVTVLHTQQKRFKQSPNKESLDFHNIAENQIS